MHKKFEINRTKPLAFYKQFYVFVSLKNLLKWKIITKMKKLICDLTSFFHTIIQALMIVISTDKNCVQLVDKIFFNSQQHFEKIISNYNELKKILVKTLQCVHSYLKRH